MGLEENPLLMLPKDFKDKIKTFYQIKGKEFLETYIKETENRHKVKFRTQWDEQLGLTNISHTPSTGLDLERSRFAPHNIYDIKSEFAKPLIEIILCYINMLETIPP